MKQESAGAGQEELGGVGQVDPAAVSAERPGSLVEHLLPETVRNKPVDGDPM